jgi:DNA repair protein RecO (recombination protein O)
MTSTTTEAVVLRQVPFRGYDRRIIAYTHDLGKVETIARGTQKITSKLAGSLEPLRLIALSIAHGPRNDQVIGAVVRSARPRALAQLPRFAVASSLAELIDQLTKPYIPDERLFHLLCAALERLNDPEPLARRFADFLHLRALSILGYSPELSACLTCREDKEDGVFDADHGGFRCSACAPQRGPALSRAARAALAAFLQDEGPALAPPELSADLVRRIRHFVRVKLDRPLRSDAFLTRALREENERQA